MTGHVKKQEVLISEVLKEQGYTTGHFGKWHLGTLTDENQNRWGGWAKDPIANASLIWFTIWSSIIHAGIMMVQAILDETERANLLGDVPALFLVGIVLWYLMPKERS